MIAVLLLVVLPGGGRGQARDEGAATGVDDASKAGSVPGDSATHGNAEPEKKEKSVPPRELTEEDREMQKMLAVAEDFRDQTKEYKREVQQIIEHKYTQQRQAVVGSYNQAISKLEQEENQRRLKAIEVFKRFLAKYPASPDYTPGALWRLAELYYEKSEVDFNGEEAAYDKQLQAFNKGEMTSEPVPPVKHFELSIGLLQHLTETFPDYKLIDGAYYLMAYCLQEQGEQEEAQTAYQTFTRRFSKSKLLPEVWTRMGESYFEDPNKLDQAIEAYSRVLDYPDNRMYDKALYKLAWTYYKIDKFDQAVGRFDELIQWSDKGAEGAEDASRTELRKEAMEYLAISFAEQEWPGSGVENAKVFLKGRGGRKYDGEFFRKLGEVFFIDGAYDKCIAAYHEAIKRYPLDKDNPKLMSAIVDAYYRLQKPQEATKAQEELVASFGPGTAWREANKDNTDVVGEADKLAENAMYTAAVRHHTLAQRFKEQERPEEARQEYAKAAAVYADYIARFPDTRDSYKLGYYLSECYYYSLDFEKAAVAYTKVRDDPAGTEFLADSANAVVLSYLNLAKLAEKEGRLDPLKLYTSKDRPKELPFTEKTIPPLRKKLISACDVYAAKMPHDEQVGNMIFRTAKIYYAYDHLDKSRERFARIVAESKDKDLVTSSINLIVESYLVTQDWPQVEAWSRKLATLSRDPAQKKALKEFELGARFNKANEFMHGGKSLLDESRQDEARQKLDAAASEFIKLVDDDPRGKTSDKALNNAALCYTWSSRPLSAGKIYGRIVKEYPKSDFADQALFLMAGSAESSYQFQLAIDNYLKLVDGYKDSKFRADALFNAAVDLEGDQQYGRAAQAYERYAKLFPDRPDTVDNFFRAGVVLEKKKSYREVIALYGRFMRAYRRDSSQREKMVVAQGKIAAAWEKLGDRRRSRKAYAETLKLYNTYKLSAGGQAAEAAARAKFMLAEMNLKGYEDITFKVSPRKLSKTLKHKAEMLKKAEDRYRSVFVCKRVQWTLAAYYRLGYLYENFADVLVNSPCPKGLNEEECDIYKGKLQDLAEAPIRKAVSAYQVTMEKTKEFKVVNAWTEKAYASLNRFEPLQFPLEKEPQGAMVVDRFGPTPMLRAAESGIKPAGK